MLVLRKRPWDLMSGPTDLKQGPSLQGRGLKHEPLRAVSPRSRPSRFLYGERGHSAHRRATLGCFPKQAFRFTGKALGILCEALEAVSPEEAGLPVPCRSASLQAPGHSGLFTRAGAFRFPARSARPQAHEPLRNCLESKAFQVLATDCLLDTYPHVVTTHPHMHPDRQVLYITCKICPHHYRPKHMLECNKEQQQSD